MTMWTTKTTKFKESEAQLQSFSNQVNILWPKNLVNGKWKYSLRRDDVVTEMSSKENKSNHRQKTNKQKKWRDKNLKEKKIRDWENKSRRHKLQIIEFPN